MHPAHIPAAIVTSIGSRLHRLRLFLVRIMCRLIRGPMGLGVGVGAMGLRRRVMWICIDRLGRRVGRPVGWRLVLAIATCIIYTLCRRLIRHQHSAAAHTHPHTHPAMHRPTQTHKQPPTYPPNSQPPTTQPQSPTKQQPQPPQPTQIQTPQTKPPKNTATSPSQTPSLSNPQNNNPYNRHTHSAISAA